MGIINFVCNLAIYFLMYSYICIKIFVHEYSYIAPSVAIISSLGKRFPHSAGKLGSVDYSFFKPIQKINGETV